MKMSNTIILQIEESQHIYFDSAIGCAYNLRNAAMV